MGQVTASKITNEAGISLEIRVLGEFAVLRKGEHVDLPTSRKTRALLAYLAMMNRPQQRDHLCEMFWDVADDPRRALRWSLWHIRRIVNSKGYSALVTDNSSVFLHTQFLAVDFWHIEASMRDLASLNTLELEKIAHLFRGQFLDDLSLPRCPEFEAWRISFLNDANLFKERILRTLIDTLEKDESRASPYADALHAMYLGT